ncbi:MAG: cytochrome c3 family protein [Candidatus Zixiibacteriota bacterium]
MQRYIRVFAIAVLFGLLTASTRADQIDFKAGVGVLHPSSLRPANSRDKLATDAVVTYHYGATLTCSQCHVMHASQQHPNEGQSAGDPFGPFPQSFTPNTSLLKAADPVALCLTCHDNVTGIPDVVNEDANGLAERSAGHFGSPGVNNPKGHKLDYGLKTDDWELCMRCHFGGTFTTASVTCIDCHNPHGNGRPRNLQWASYPGGEPQFGLLQNPGATGMAKYERANVGYGTDNTENLREVTNMCIDCHHVFTGQSYNDPNNDGIHSLHPSYDSERGDPNNIAQGVAKGSVDVPHWEDGTGAGFVFTPRLRFVNDGATDFVSSHVVDASANGVLCLSCHKAHGGDNAFGLLWNPQTGINGEGCEQCHNRSAQ